MSLYLKSITVINPFSNFLKTSARCVRISRRYLYCDINRTKWQKDKIDAPSVESAETKSKKSKDLLKITLMQNQNITITSLEEARNLAKRRSMHLIQLQENDSKTHRPVYKLLSNAEMLAEQLSDVQTNEQKSTTPNEKVTSKKSEKLLNIGSRIGEHDMVSRLKNISKWLNKGHNIRVFIQANNNSEMGKCDSLYKMIDDHVSGANSIGKIVQKHIKGSVIKFNIIPTITATEGSKNDASDV